MNPSVTDQVAEVVKQLNKAAHDGYEPDPLLLQSARLIATLAAEVEAWRIAKPLSAVSLIDTPIRKARQATDALLAEVNPKDKNHGQV